jgi:hypothetical protein
VVLGTVVGGFVIALSLLIFLVAGRFLCDRKKKRRAGPALRRDFS